MMQRARTLLTYAMCFVAGGLISYLVQQSTNSNRQCDVKPLQQNSGIPYIGVPTKDPPTPETQDMPLVYMYSDGTLKQVPDFCKWTAQYDCAEMDTEQGPIPVYINPYKEGVFSVGSSLKKSRTWETRIMNVLLPELKKYPEAGFFDIGSNIGPFSLVAANMGRKVITVDAVVHNILKVCRSVMKNKFTDKIKMVANPVFDEHKAVTLKTWPADTFERTEIAKGPIAQKNVSVCSSSVVSQTVMLDDLLQLATFKSAVMKVDVESFEYYVLNGGKRLFSEIDVHSIIMEWQHVKKRDKAGALIKLLKQYKYVPYGISGKQDKKKLDFARYLNWTHDVFLVKSP